MSNRKDSISFAIVGCGRIAKNHVQPLTSLPRARLLGVCDLLLDRAVQFGQQGKVPAFENYHEMIGQLRPDVVCILTPSGMHPLHAKDIMERYQCHVAIEKPMALRLDDAHQMKEVADQLGLKIFPIYQNRYNKAVQFVRSELRGGALGRPVLFTVRVRWCRPQSYYERDPWRGTWAMDGGALTNQGIHYIDLLHYLGGDIDSVFCKTATTLVDIEVEDTALATVNFVSGALGVIEVTTAARPSDFEASISVLAENGTAILGGIACNKLELYTPNADAASNVNEEFPDAYGFGHYPFFADLVADLLDGKPHPEDFNSGLKALELLNALYASSEERREVELAEHTSSRRLGQGSAAFLPLYTTLLPGES